jgi:hypothetical protein
MGMATLSSMPQISTECEEEGYVQSTQESFYKMNDSFGIHNPQLRDFKFLI